MDALISLQILQSETHPQSHNQGPTKLSSGSKEGLSVYGLFSGLARTPQGKYLLRQYFLRPSLEIDVIDERLETTGIFARPDNDDPLNTILKSLTYIKNMKTVMIHLRKGVSSCLSGGIKNGVWSTLRSVRNDSDHQHIDVDEHSQFTFHTLKIRDAFGDINGAETLAIKIKVSHQPMSYSSNIKFSTDLRNFRPTPTR